MRGSLAVFSPRGHSPHQFTPMSNAHEITALDADMALLVYVEYTLRGGSELYCPGDIGTLP